MKRPMTLTAFIISTVLLGIDLILELISLPAVFALFGLAEGDVMVAVVAIVMLLVIALVVVSLVFNSISISAWNKSVAEFPKKKGKVVTAVVLNFVLVALLIISAIMSSSITVMPVLLILGLVATNVLALVDLSLEKKRVDAQAQQNAEQPTVEE